MGYRIKTVAEMIGVPRNTLLAWERRYGIVQPSRRPNGYREYSDGDVVRLRELKRLIDAGHRVGEAISLMNDARASAISDPDKELATSVREDMLGALMKLERRNAEELLRRCASMSYERKIDQIIFPLLRDVGDLWMEGELNVAQEHYISAFCREQLIGMLVSVDYGPTAGRLTICAAYPDELHDLAILGLAAKLAMKNHRIVFLGAQTPIEPLCALIEAHAPELVCLSLTLPRSASDVVACAQRIASISDTLTVAFGGAGLPLEELPLIPRVLWTNSMRGLLH